MSTRGRGHLTGQFCEGTGRVRTGLSRCPLQELSYVSRAACRRGGLQRLLSDTDGCGRTAAGTGRSIVPDSRSTVEPCRRRRRRRSVRTSRGGDLRRGAPGPPPIPADTDRSSAVPGTSRNGPTVAGRRGGAGSIYPVLISPRAALGSESPGGPGFGRLSGSQGRTSQVGRAGFTMTEVAEAKRYLLPVILPDTESTKPSWMRFTNFNLHLKHFNKLNTALAGWRSEKRQSEQSRPRDILT